MSTTNRRRTDETGGGAARSPAPLPPPRTVGQLHALISAALAIVERKAPMRALTRRDLAALLRAALRYKRAASERSDVR